MMAPRYTPTVSDSADPFADVLQSLRDSAKDVGVLVDPLQSVDSIISTMDQVLDDVSKIPSILEMIDDLLTGVDAILDVLDAVPFVDGVAVACEGVVGTAQTLLKGADEMATDLDHTVVEPCKTIFDDLEKGMHEALHVVTTISQTIPNYINTILILTYMEDVAKPLVKVLKGTDSEQRLNKLLDEFDAVKKGVAEALDPVATFLHDLDKAMQAIIHALGDEYEKIKSTAHAVAADLDWVEAKFRPLEDGFNKVLHAIAPVKWALDAIKWVFDHVFQPVVEAILKETGLEGEIDKVKDKIEEKLGIKPIADLLSQHVDSSTSSGWQGSAGSQSAAGGANNWTTLADVLKAYNTRDSDGTKRDILMLVNAITGTAIDPEKPAPVPDWPHVPDFHGIDSAAVSQISFTAALGRSRRAARIDQAFAALEGIGRRVNGTDGSSKKSVGARPRFMAMNLPQVAELPVAAGLDNVVLLRQRSREAVQSLKDVDRVAGTLVTSLERFDAARQLPGDFHTQMEDFAELFQDAEKLLSFLEEFDVLSSILTELDEPLKQHAQQASTIEASVKQLVDASQGVDVTVQGVEKAVPDVTVFTDAFNFIDAAATGSASLARMIDQAEALDEKLGGRFSSRISDLADRVNSAAGAVLTQLDEVTGATSAALKDAEAINDYLAGYASGFVKLGADSKIVGDAALPKLTKGVHYFGVFVSVLDPLSCLLQEADCVSGSDPLKRGAAKAVKVIRAAADSGIQDQDHWVEEAFDFVLDEAVPMKDIEADVDAINGFVSQQKSSFEGAVGGIEKNLAQLASAMEPRASYTLNGTKIDNVLVDQSFVDAASKLYKEIAEACRQAGIA